MAKQQANITDFSKLVHIEKAMRGAKPLKSPTRRFRRKSHLRRNIFIGTLLCIGGYYAYTATTVTQPHKTSENSASPTLIEQAVDKVSSPLTTSFVYAATTTTEPNKAIHIAAPPTFFDRTVEKVSFSVSYYMSAIEEFVGDLSRGHTRSAEPQTTGTGPKKSKTRIKLEPKASNPTTPKLTLEASLPTGATKAEPN